MPYLRASAVVIPYEEALYQVYVLHYAPNPKERGVNDPNLRPYCFTSIATKLGSWHGETGIEVACFKSSTTPRKKGVEDH